MKQEEEEEEEEEDEEERRREEEKKKKEKKKEEGRRRRKGGRRKEKKKIMTLTMTTETMMMEIRSVLVRLRKEARLDQRAAKANIRRRRYCMAIQSKSPSNKQSIGEARATTICITTTSTKHASIPADFFFQ